MAECTVKAFRDTMVRNYKSAAVSWANEYSPILDVTNTVRKVSPNVTKALLTIYGDDLAKIKVVEPGVEGKQILYPDGRPADRETFGDKVIINAIYNWLAGYEFERETCENDGKQYWIIYPCKFEWEGTLQLPCTKETFKGEQDEVKDVTDTVSQYIVQPKVIKATLTIYKTKPIAVIGVYEGMPDRYPDGRPADREKYGKDAIKNIVENWFRGQEWERIEYPRNSGKWYWVIYPCKLRVETEPVGTPDTLQFEMSPQNPNLGEQVTVRWSDYNGWSKRYKFRIRFILIKPNGEQEQVFYKEYDLDPGKTMTGSFTFTMPDLPGKYTLVAMTDIYYSGDWAGDDRVSYSWIIPGKEEPTVYDFVNTLVQHYGSKTPTIDVSKTLERRLPEDPEHDPPKEYLDNITLFGVPMTYADDNYGCCAKLTLHLEGPGEIEVIEYGYDMPPKRYTWSGNFASNVVKGWLEGYEMVRMYSPKSGKWYWVKIPCDFVYEFKKASPILQIDGTKGTITYGYKGSFYALGDWGGADAVLLIDGKMVDKIDISYDDWKASPTKEFKKTISIPPLKRGYHTITVIYCSVYRSVRGDTMDYGRGAVTKQIYVVELPHARIIKDSSRYGIFYNGRALEPGKEHQILKGSKIEYFAMAQNVGGPGNIWIRLLVNGVEVDRAEGGSPAIKGTITVDRDMTIKFEAGHGDVKDDEWGC